MFQAAAQAQWLKVDIIYTNGHILSGSLSADLAELPASVQASLTLNGSGPGDDNLEDVLQASLVFDDGDNDGDQNDFGVIQLCQSGADIPGDPACAL